MKTGIQMMFESMLGEQGMKAVEEVKRIIPSIPQLIQTIKTEWEAMRQELRDLGVQRDVDGEQREDMLVELQQVTRLCERIATQNNLILGRLEAIEMKADPNKMTETPPTLMHYLEHDACPHGIKYSECDACQENERAVIALERTS